MRATHVSFGIFHVICRRAGRMHSLAYARERKEGLLLYLDDPDVDIDTNSLERALRAIPMGRRNWLFCWTEVGALSLPDE